MILSSFLLCWMTYFGLFLVYFLSLFFSFFFCTRWNSYFSNLMKKNEREVYFLTLHIRKYLYYSIIVISTRLDRNKFPSECYRHFSKGVCFQSDCWKICSHLQPPIFVQVYSFPLFWSLYKLVIPLCWALLQSLHLKILVIHFQEFFLNYFLNDFLLSVFIIFFFPRTPIIWM